MQQLAPVMRALRMRYMIFDKHLGLSEHSRTSISNMKDPLDTIHLLLARELLSESADMTIDGERHEVSQHAHQLIPESDV
jgi:hypothetical protein